ncbi:dockerin type I domain-containing protein [Synechococcus lacustris]|uniref:dockerin type I domain-containing protein n=1 Tax=Synechococcus lacustris TaxID=2116544 RepID=UPI0020CD419B|nr:dockerin type I domain-containing protein [Synechococcus lacustris]MCP9812592.1 hypothetical protein [Synechococcus lacustris Maggiore-St4-Slac]
MAFAKPNTILSTLLNQWKNLLQQWAKGGSLAAAAQEALLLSGIPEGLQILIDEWALADFKSLPEVELLSAVDISGAMGAYAISTGKIYLNETWVDNASKEDVFAVLTEELWHHLDGLFNTVDTPGDEGQLFAALLTSNVDVSDNKKEAVQAEADHGIAILFGSEVAVEQSKASYTVDTSLVNLKIISGKTGGVASGLASFYSNDEEIILVVGNKYDYSTPSWITSNYILTKSLKSGLENIFDYINPSSKLYTTLASPTIANGNKLIFRGISFSAATFKQTLSFNQIEFNELRPGSQKVIASYEYEDFADSDIHSFFGNKLGDQIVRKNNQLISFGPHSWSSNIPSYENLISVAAGQANDGSAIIVSATGLRKFPVSGEGYQVDGKTVITKINADGTTAWNNEFDFATLGEDYFVANIDDLTHDFLLAGSLQDNLGIGSLISFTAEGTQKWRLDLHNLPHSRITSASIDSSGNIFIAGTWQFDWTWNRYNNMANGIPPSAADVGTNLAFYGLVSKEGTLEWTNTYGDNTGSIFGCEILSAKSGNIILTGTSTSKQIFGITPNVGSSSNGYPYMYGYIAEISVPQSQVRITLTPSAASISEGAVFTSTVAATNLTTGTTLYYALSGTGITTADFSAGPLIGEGVTDATGKFTFTHTIANDLTTEGAESVEIKLYSDEARKVQVGATASVSINDTSVTTPPQVSVAATANGKETDGSPVVFTFTRTGSTSAALSINYQLFGTAQAGSDYTGNTSGTINFAAGSSSATLSLPALADGALIDPYETIIARINPATNYEIATGKQFATATITAEGMVVVPKGRRRYSGDDGGEWGNSSTFAALKSDGSVICWGGKDAGGTAPAGLTGVSQIFSTGFAFAALKSDGSVICWGGFDPDEENKFQEMVSPAGLTGVSQIFCNWNAFAALKNDGSVVTWGSDWSGGNAPAGLTGVSQIFSTESTFAALKSDGTVVSWGGGNAALAPEGLTGVTQIFSIGGGFAALKSDGSVISWGNSNYGGSAPMGLTGVSQIFSTGWAFAALKNDGSVICWGDKDRGGVAPAGLTGVSQIFPNEDAFAALKSDGSLICWGNKDRGGVAPAGLTGVSQIFSLWSAFAALKSDGSVISWGSKDNGESIETPAEVAGVSQIFSNDYAFAALKNDGSVISWGDSLYGGVAPAGLTGVSQIFSTRCAFAALKNDGSVVSWGKSDYDGSDITTPVGLSGVVGFANPYTDDRLVIDATPTYNLTPSATTINEGAVLTSTVTTTNVALGATLYYMLSGTGITSVDFSSGALTGEGITDATGKFAFTHTLANDLTTEGAETLIINLYSDSARTLQVGTTASVSIVDTSIKSKSFNLDVDGDGKITALGDGLMIIRKLFGAAFAGDALTNKAMSPTSTRTSAEIHEFIQQGITNELLDVDKDGKTTALGDGLMVIRHLFGAAFAGAALTNKAISPDSPYFGTTVNFAAVAANIDALKIL